ncbi:MAG: hypothetical protein FWD87_06460 [Spirochaetaceae bacterium]|nr:hypothetical protein [Spirochaetaceae bacterium]
METINTISSIAAPFSHILKAGYSGGSLSVPVSDAGISTRFKHITGIPLPSDSSNVSYTRLRQLDMLIAQIGKLRDREIVEIDFESIEQGQLQHIIDNFAYELRNGLNSQADPYQRIYSPGSILNMTA